MSDHAACPLCARIAGGVGRPTCPLCAGHARITLGHHADLTPNVVAIAIRRAVDTTLEEITAGALDPSIALTELADGLVGDGYLAPPPRTDPIVDEVARARRRPIVNVEPARPLADVVFLRRPR
jgi:hypothetical protein